MSSNFLQSYNQTFLNELEKLNEAQREAVNQIEGPVLVIAGPGTGKTHLLAARIGRILLDTDTQAHNILCLTFTDAGVTAMRQRLLQWIGPEAHRVHIFTFHSFCNSVIRDNLELFGKHDLEPISELERVELIRDILDRVKPDNPLVYGRHDVYFYEKHLQDLFKRMKMEDWSPQYVIQKIEEYLKSLPERAEFRYKRNGIDFKKGDLRHHKIAEEAEKMERLRAGVLLFSHYMRRMNEIQRYDFDDMIAWVLRAFEQHKNLLQNYQERYLYVLVDEYQDTNGSQNHVLQQLISYWKNPNIFIVGDDDQSIYEFQGARLKNLSNFYDQYYESIKLVLLTENYRSSQLILDASKNLIDYNTHRIIEKFKPQGLTKRLLARHTVFADLNILPKITAYPNELHEVADVIQQMEKLQKAGVPLKDIAIIYAKHRQVQPLVALFEKRGIPYNIRRQINILHLPFIQNILTYLEYIQFEYTKPYSGESLVFKILHFDFWKISIHFLAKMSFTLAKDEQNTIWRDALMIPDSAFYQAKFTEVTELLLQSYANETVPQLFEKFINRSGLLDWVLAQSDKIWLLQVLGTFSNFIREEADKNPHLTLHRLLELIQNMEANNLSIGLQKNIEMPQGVHLLTAHSAKGLEYEYVFLFDCTKDHWEPSHRSGIPQFAYPDTLTLSGEEDALEARRRLFYVAMTRAKAFLNLSYSLEKGQPTIFIDELLQNSGLKVQQKTADAKLLLETQILNLRQAEKPHLDAQNKAWIDDILLNFRLSVSSLNAYLECPLSFYYENILKIPVLTSAAAAYGVSMHYAFMRLFEKMKLSKQRFFPAQTDFIAYFVREMHRQQFSFSKKEFERRLAAGQRNLGVYYAHYHQHWHKNVLIEHLIQHTELEGIPITGIIDKIELYPQENRAHIVDYKTGSHDSKKLQRPSESNPNGGIYWRQLVFYKILYETHRKDSLSVRSGEIVYLDTDKKGDFLQKNIEISMEDAAFISKLVRETYQKIQEHAFYEGCGKPTCTWCNFVKNNITPNSFANEMKDSLDDIK